MVQSAPPPAIPPLPERRQDGVDACTTPTAPGGFEPLCFLAKNKQVVLGVMTSKTGALESKDQLKRRIDEASKFAPLEQLCLSPQCGFASTEEGNLLAEDEQWAKLGRCFEVAKEVWD